MNRQEYKPQKWRKFLRWLFAHLTNLCQPFHKHQLGLAHWQRGNWRYER